MLKEFPVSDRWWSDIWGGGHTPETLPTAKGWRAALSKKGGDILVIGRSGQPHCASVRRMADGLLDVALYEGATPEELRAALELPRGDPGRDAIADPVYRQVAPIPGWGLYVLDELAEYTS